MKLDEDRCYKAVKSRDRRFDGKFFTAVKTTGIYCRPVCPAVTPKRKNVVFFVCAAAAEGAGFRPCRRCHPEAAPGTPAWMGTGAIVYRALRYINEGFLDEGSIEELALHMGMGERHLRRLFREHLGTTPVAIAQTRRLHFARNLLTTSSLSITDTAMASGFGSLRRFNTLFKKAFGAPPSQFRKEPKKCTDGLLTYKLPIRLPYDWKSLVAFLRPRAIPGVEKVSTDGSTYIRTIDSCKGAGRLVVEGPQKSKDFITAKLALPTIEGAIRAVAKVRRMFDCNSTPAEISMQLSAFDELKALVKKRPGLRLPGAWDPFELTIRAILGQQVTVAAATTISSRLVNEFGQPLSQELVSDGLTHLFPTPETLARADLSSIGLPRKRQETINEFARAVSKKELLLDAPAGVDDFVTRFTRIKGIGHWTAHYVALRAFSEPDAFPFSDLGLCKALSLKPKELSKLAENWRPWRSYGAVHLWLSLSDR